MQEVVNRCSCQVSFNAQPCDAVVGVKHRLVPNPAFVNPPRAATAAAITTAAAGTAASTAGTSRGQFKQSNTANTTTDTAGTRDVHPAATGAAPW